MTDIDQELQAAFALLARREHGAAAAAFDRALQLDRNSAAAWLGLAEARREQGAWNDAIAAAARAIQLTAGGTRDRFADAHTAHALALLGAQRNSDALMAAVQAAALADAAGDPARIAAARRVLGLARLRAGRLNEAEAEIAAALRAVPDYPEGMAALALLRLLQQRFDEAGSLFRQSLDARDEQAEAWANYAALLARLGRVDDALRAVDRAVRLKPFLAGPQHLQGTLLQGAGQADAAADAFARALRADPDHTDARINLANTLRLLGRTAEAADVCRAGLERRPDDPALLTNLGVALQAAGDGDGALAAYEQAMAAAAAANGGLRPDLPEIDNNIARLHQAAGRTAQALGYLLRAHAARPNDPDIARSYAALLLDAGRPADALAPARRAAATADGQTPAAHLLLGRILARLDQADDADAAFMEAIRRAPTDADVWSQAGIALLRTGRRVRAAGCLQQAARMTPDDARGWALLGQAFRGLRFFQCDDALRADLLAALTRPGMEVTHLMEATASVILLSPAVARLADPNARDDDATTWPDAPGILPLAADRLTLRLLELAVIPDPALERAFTRLRRNLLTRGCPAVWLSFACALAIQCHLNEYAWAETPAETAAIDRLESALNGDLAAGRVPAAALALYAAYRPLSALPDAARLCGFAPPAAAGSTGEPDPTGDAGRLAALDRLLTRQAREPLAEAALKPTIPRLTPIADAVSRSVRDQYEENPYPRWTVAGLLNRPLPVPAAIRSLFPHVTLPDDPRWDAPEALVAGCGSGRESLWTANQFRGVSVLAVDLSLTSLAYARRQGEQAGLDNIVYGQADILQLETLNRRFDIIQSVGVLHHMADPFAGWRILTNLLRPGGLMKIGLYSERARVAVTAGRAFIAERGYGVSAAEIRRFRQDALALPDDHPARPATGSADFYSVSACRDLLFHVQEHRMTPLQIAGWLDQLGLEFLGFQHEDPMTAQLYRTRFPDDPHMVSLANWDRFEEERPLTFGALYQFWVRRPD